MNLRSKIIVGCAGAFLIASAGVLTQPGFAPPDMALTQVRDNVYMIRSGSSGNVTMITSDAGVVLIDDKFQQDHEAIMGFVRSVTDAPIRYVINTHLHGDHTGGNARMQDLGIDVIASQNARRIMAETQAAGLPNIVIDDYLRIYLGDTAIDLHYFGRGHTDGDVVVHLPEERIVIMGDLFALWGPYQPVIHYAAGGSLRDWPRSLERALNLDFDTVIPGHSGLTDRANIQGYIDHLVETQNAVRTMNRERKSRDEIRAMLAEDFGWSGLVMNLGLDGAILEMQ